MAQGSTGYPAPKAAELCGGTDPNGKIQSLQLDANKNLKITGTISASNPSVGTNGQTAPTSSTEVGIIDNSGNLQGVSSSNPLPATVAGVSTAANQATEITALQAIQAQTVPDFISVNNSSTVVLAGGATFTGVFEDVSQYAEMRVIVYSDQSSATNGLNLQYSSNGTVADAYDFYTITGGAGAQYGAGAGSQYFRVVYTNGSTTQTTFRLQTVYKKFRTKPSSQRQQDGYTNETDLEQTWAFNSVWNGSTWDRLPGSAANGATVNFPAGATSANQSTEIGYLSTIATNSAATPADRTASGNISALNTGVSILFSSTATVHFEITGTWAATLTFQYLEADGVTYTTSAVAYAGYAGAGVTSTAANGVWSIPTYGYKGLRVFATAFTSGTATVSLNATNATMFVKAIQDTAANLAMTATVASGTITTVQNTMLALPTQIMDVASAAITATATAGPATPAAGCAYMVGIQVTAVSGTTPTMTTAIQESFDSGVTFMTVYTFPTITAIGDYLSPVLVLRGNRVQYVQTITGTTPSFTRSIIRTQTSSAHIIQSGTGVANDGSGTTSATPSTSTQAIGLNQFRRYLAIQNPSTNTGTLWFNFTSAATAGSGSFALQPGGAFTMETGTVFTDAVNVLSTTASLPFTIKQA